MSFKRTTKLNVKKIKFLRGNVKKCKQILKFGEILMKILNKNLFKI